MKDVDYPAPSKKEIHRLLDYDDAWLSRKVREVADSKSSYDEESILASSLIKRQPIKRVVEKIAYMERDSQRIDPDFTAIETLGNFKEEIAKKAQISPHLIFFDKPWKDLPLESRYRQYTQEKDGSARLRTGRINFIFNNLVNSLQINVRTRIETYKINIKAEG